MEHDLARQIEDTHRKTQETRYRFLATELDLCASTIDFGSYELAQGNRPVASKEFAIAGRAVATIEKFLPELEDPEKRRAIQLRLDQARQSLETFRRKL